MDRTIAMGPFTCDVRLSRVRAPEFVREEKEGVIYITADDYELGYETTLEFDDGGKMLVKAKVFGEGSNMMVIRDAQGKPTRMRGWVKGSVQILDEHDQLIFRGTYNDVNVVWTLAGDEALTPTDTRLEHWESGFGEGDYLGHFFSMRADMARESGALAGRGVGVIE
jgi:hypothetical protein